MKTIELIRKLSELGRLVEIWEEPTDEALEYLGWKCTETTSCHTPLYIKVNHQTLASKEIVLNDFEKAWNHEITQASFKAEVRKVAEYLEKEINYKGNRPCQRDIDLHNFNTLFSILMESLAKRDCVSYWEGNNPIDAYFALYAICHKLGVELESEDKQ